MIKKFLEAYNDLVDSVNDMIIYNFCQGIVPMDKVGIWIKEHPESPLDGFNLFLCSNGYQHHLADIVTRRIIRGGENGLDATNLIDRTRGHERPLNEFRDQVIGGLKKGYTIKYIHLSPNGKKIQENYITDVFLEDSIGHPLSEQLPLTSGAALCPSIEAAYPLDTLDEAKALIKDLSESDYLLRSRFVIPVIVELHESPFKNREIRMPAFTYTK